MVSWNWRVFRVMVKKQMEMAVVIRREAKGEEGWGGTEERIVIVWIRRVR